jgi:type VI secretion system secreted protein VgrG
MLSPAGVTIMGTMVLINSGGAAGSGAGASPTAPTEPEDACEADPGQATTVAPPETVAPENVSLEHIGPMAAALAAAAGSGAPFCDI